MFSYTTLANVHEMKQQHQNVSFQNDCNSNDLYALAYSKQTANKSKYTDVMNTVRVVCTFSGILFTIYRLIYLKIIYSRQNKARHS